jgi:intracellular multiplication protein IcmG
MENNPTSSSDSEEEYHFATEPETAGVFAPPSPAQKGDVMGRIKRKNILVAAGVIVVVFSIYKILDVIITRHSHEVIPRASQTTEFPTRVTPLPPPPAPMPVEEPAPKPVDTTASPASDTAPVTNRLSALEEQNTNFQSSIDKLNSQVTELQTAVANMNSQITALNQGIQNIADKLAEQEAKEAALHAVKVHTRKVHHIRIRPIYFVRAIIPGRAWLSTSHGGTVTVRLGDNLPGYGVVQAIDPVQGTITTSVGAIIGYSPGDS